jgi:hypothetical protein
MTMPPRLRKFALAAHVTFSVGWLGAVVAYLALAIAGLSTHDVSMLRAAYLSMELIGWFVIVPLSFAALLTGLVQSLGHPVGPVPPLLDPGEVPADRRCHHGFAGHMPAVSRTAAKAAEMTPFGADFRALQIQLVVHAAGGLLALLAATILSVYKPWGMTSYGRRRQDERRRVPQADLLAYPASSVGRDQGSAASASRWVCVIGIHAIGLILLFVLLHLTGGGPRSH